MKNTKKTTFELDKELYKKFKIYLIENELTMKELFEGYIKRLLLEEGK